MKINDARSLLDQIEKISPKIDVLIVVPHEPVKGHLDEFDVRAVLQNSAWNVEEVVFKDKKLDLQNQKTS